MENKTVTVFGASGQYGLAQVRQFLGARYALRRNGLRRIPTELTSLAEWAREQDWVLRDKGPSVG